MGLSQIAFGKIHWDILEMLKALFFQLHQNLILTSRIMEKEVRIIFILIVKILKIVSINEELVLVDINLKNFEYGLIINFYKKVHRLTLEKLIKMEYLPMLQINF